MSTDDQLLQTLLRQHDGQAEIPPEFTDNSSPHSLQSHFSDSGVAQYPAQFYPSALPQSRIPYPKELLPPGFHPDMYLRPMGQAKGRTNYVARACVNCKKSHIACDNARPCKVG